MLLVMIEYTRNEMVCQWVWNLNLNVDVKRAVTGHNTIDSERPKGMGS